VLRGIESKEVDRERDDERGKGGCRLQLRDTAGRGMGDAVVYGHFFGTGDEMAHQDYVQWDLKNGIITLHKDGAQSRLLLKRYDFVFSFFDEMNSVLGKDPVMMVFRRILDLYGAPREMQEQVSLEVAGRFLDSLVVPVNIEKSTIPDEIIWDGKTRTLDFFRSTHWRVLPLSFIRNFRIAAFEILTENGTKAIVREATRRAGAGMAEQALQNYRWTKLQDLLENQDEEIYLGTFRYAGWSYARVFSDKDARGNPLFLAKISDSYESDGVRNSGKPICIWQMNYMDGFYNGVVNKLAGKFVETREVRCRAMGDPYCAFAHKIKDNRKDILDWRNLEPEWKRLDAMPFAER
jgi:predicted hydrocarbon binding protein